MFLHNLQKHLDGVHFLDFDLKSANDTDILLSYYDTESYFTR